MHRPLTEQDLFEPGTLRRLGRRVLLFPEVQSTNAYLLAHAAALPDGALALAEHQSAGRGRQGRRWLAPRGAGVLLSVLLHEQGGWSLGDAQSAPMATLAAALAACEAIESTCACRPSVRWPNDLVLNERKLGGVLAESTPLPASAAGSARRALVVGIGINCLQQSAHFEGELREKATSLEIACAHAVDRAAVARALIASLDRYFSVPPEPSLVSAWRARCGDVGQRVHLLRDGRRYTGTILDIGEQGELVVELDSGGRQRFASATTTRDW